MCDHADNCSPPWHARQLVDHFRSIVKLSNSSSIQVSYVRDIKPSRNSITGISEGIAVPDKDKKMRAIKDTKNNAIKILKVSCFFRKNCHFKDTTASRSKQSHASEISSMLINQLKTFSSCRRWDALSSLPGPRELETISLACLGKCLRLFPKYHTNQRSACHENECTCRIVESQQMTFLRIESNPKAIWRSRKPLTFEGRRDKWWAKSEQQRQTAG